MSVLLSKHPVWKVVLWVAVIVLVGLSTVKTFIVAEQGSELSRAVERSDTSAPADPSD